ncbi:hypothetical protein V496_01921, partial [Pseudogymnoascus sp. VKM F-4515 (FW-2607)]
MNLIYTIIAFSCLAIGSDVNPLYSNSSAVTNASVTTVNSSGITDLATKPSSTIGIQEWVGKGCTGHMVDLNLTSYFGDTNIYTRREPYSSFRISRPLRGREQLDFSREKFTFGNYNTKLLAKDFTRTRVPAELQDTPDPVVENAIAATQRARVAMIQKYTKKHDIQHFDIGAIVSLKIPREDRTSTDNKRIFARILEEPYPHRYQVITVSGIIKRLIPTKSLAVVEQALWADILIPTSTKQVALGLAAREASTSARVGIFCLATRTEMALVERPRRKRARADTCYCTCGRANPLAANLHCLGAGALERTFTRAVQFTVGPGRVIVLAVERTHRGESSLVLALERWSEPSLAANLHLSWRWSESSLAANLHLAWLGA